MKNKNEVGKLEGGNYQRPRSGSHLFDNESILKPTSIKSIGGMRKTANDDTLGPNRRPAARRGPVFIS
jgi:hypothetical protein